MESRKKLKIISSVFAAIAISSLAIGLGVGLSLKNNGDVISKKEDTNNFLKITPTQDTYNYYGSGNSSNSVITFDTSGLYNNPKSELSAFSVNNINKATYQWQYSLDNNGSDWTNFSNANEDVYNLYDLPESLINQNKFYVRCAITIGKNTTYSNVVTININNFSTLSLQPYVSSISNLNTSYVINLQNNSNNTIYMNNSKIITSNNLYWNNSSTDSTNVISFNINNITNINEINNIQLISNDIDSSTINTINKTYFGSNLSKYITLDTETDIATFTISKSIFTSLLSNFSTGLTSLIFEITINKNLKINDSPVNFTLQVGNINLYNINPIVTTKNITLDQNTISTDEIQFTNNLTSLFNSYEISCTSNLLMNTKTNTESSISEQFTAGNFKWTGEENYVTPPTNLNLSETYYYAVGVNFIVTLNNTKYNMIIYSNISNLNLYTTNLSKYSIPSLLGNQTVDALYDPNWTQNGYYGIIPYATASAATGLLGTGIPDTTGNWTVGAYWYIQNFNNVTFGTAEISQIYYYEPSNQYLQTTDGTINKYITSSMVVFDDQDGYIYLNLTSLTADDWSALNGQVLNITIPFTLGTISSSLTLSNLVFHETTNPYQVVGSTWYNTASTSNNSTYSLDVNQYLAQNISSNDLGVTYDWEYSTSEDGTYKSFSSNNGNDTYTLKTLPTGIKEGDTLYIKCVISIQLYYIGTLGGTGSSSNYTTSPLAVNILSVSN